MELCTLIVQSNSLFGCLQSDKNHPQSNMLDFRAQANFDAWFRKFAVVRSQNINGQ